jgi:hypothetical protein
LIAVRVSTCQNAAFGRNQTGDSLGISSCQGTTRAKMTAIGMSMGAPRHKVM